MSSLFIDCVSLHFASNSALKRNIKPRPNFERGLFRFAEGTAIRSSFLGKEFF